MFRNDRLIEARNQAKMSLAQLAEAAGVSRTHIWELEQGRTHNPTVRTVKALSIALKTCPEHLMGLDYSKHRNLTFAYEQLNERDRAIVRKVIDTFPHSGKGVENEPFSLSYPPEVDSYAKGPHTMCDLLSGFTMYVPEGLVCWYTLRPDPDYKEEDRTKGEEYEE